MSANPDTSAPTGRKIPAQGKERSDAALGHASQNTPAPKGRNMPAQGNALGNTSQNTSSPEGATQGGWPVVPLGEIAEVKLGKMLDKAKHQTGRRFPYLRNINVRWGTVDTDDVFEMHFEDDQVERFSLCAGDVLVCEGGEPGRAAVWNGHVADMKFQKAIHRVRFKVPFEARLLVYLLESLAKSGGLERRFTGSTIKHFTRESFVQLPIPLPPLPEQRRIVAEIEKQFTRLEAGVAALRRVQANLKRYRAAVLKAACEGRLVPTEAALARSPRSTKNGPPAYETGAALLARILTERRNNLQGRGKYEEPTVANTSKLPPLPESWAWATVEQLLRNDSGLGYGILKPGNEDPNGVPMVRVMDIGDGKLSGTEIVKVEPKLSEEFNRTVLESGDILLAVMATVGRCTVVPEHLVGANVNRALAVIKPTGLVPSKFLELALRSPRLQQLFQKNKIGSAQARINLSDLRTYCLPLPPLAEQTRIVAEVERRLSVVEELESVVTANLQRATRLRQSILQKAFTGGLSKRSMKGNY